MRSRRVRGRRYNQPSYAPGGGSSLDFKPLPEVPTPEMQKKTPIRTRTALTGIHSAARSVANAFAHFSIRRNNPKEGGNCNYSLDFASW
jgi:hypothetical protein